MMLSVHFIKRRFRMKKTLRVISLLVYAATAVLLVSCNGSDSGTPATNSCQAITPDGTTVIVGSGLPGDPAAPEAASGYRTGLKAVYAKKYMVATCNPWASKAGCEVLLKGGSAADAAVA